MAARFDHTQIQYYIGNLSIPLSLPLTYSAIVYRSETGYYPLIVATYKSTNNTARLSGYFDHTSACHAFGTYNYSAKGAINSTPINSLHHFAGVAESATLRNTYTDAQAGTASTENDATSDGMNKIIIGARKIDSNPATLPLSGNISELAIWNAALSVDEIVALSKGFKPFRVRPQSLMFYAPLVRNLSELQTGVALTTSTSSPTVADHPRVY